MAFPKTAYVKVPGTKRTVIEIMQLEKGTAASMWLLASGDKPDNDMQFKTMASLARHLRKPVATVATWIAQALVEQAGKH